MSKTKVETDSWQFMVDAARKGLEEAGYQAERIPGRGLSNVWNVTKDGRKQAASIRTTRNRWIAFPPLDGGLRWKTLDGVDLVVVASVDQVEKPRNIEIYIFEASEVRECFRAA